MNRVKLIGIIVVSRTAIAPTPVNFDFGIVQNMICGRVIGPNNRIGKLVHSVRGIYFDPHILWENSCIGNNNVLYVIGKQMYPIGTIHCFCRKKVKRILNWFGTEKQATWRNTVMIDHVAYPKLSG